MHISYMVILGRAFLTSITLEGIDQFLYAQICRKLGYWSTMKLSLAMRVVICNNDLLSTPWFFNIAWRGSKELFMRSRSAMYNYMWYWEDQLTCSRVSWKECCMDNNGRLRLVDPTIAKSNLLCKWIVKAMEPNKPNLNLSISEIMLYLTLEEEEIGGDGFKLDWSTNKQLWGYGGPKVWGQVISPNTWKVVAKGMYELSPTR